MQRDGYSVDLDRARLPMDTIVTWLQSANLASGRSAEQIRRSWDGAGLVGGLYAGDELVGCARAVTDFVSIGYLADVYVAPAYRGKGLGLWLVQSLVDHPDARHLTWLLHTRDAHGLYRRLGFISIGEWLMERRPPA